MIALDFTRRGAFTSMVIVELVWVLVLWILWISTAALASQENEFQFGDGNSCGFEDSGLSTVCHEFSAIEAFSFLAWIILLGYNITLLTFAIIGSTRGNRTWTSTVRDGGFLDRNNTNGVPAQTPMSTGGGFSSTAPSTMQYPPHQQQFQPNHAPPMTAQV